MRRKGSWHYLGIESHADPTWKTRHPGIGEFLISKSSSGADFRWIFPFAIAKARANREVGAVRQPHKQRAHSSFVPARASLMANDHSFRVVERFNFQERAGTTGDVFGRRLAEH